VTGGPTFHIGFDPFFTEVQGRYEATGEGLEKWPPPLPEEIPDEHQAIEESGLFTDVRVRRYLWTVDYTADSYLDLLSTYSGHIAMKQPERDTLYAEIRRRISARPSVLISEDYLSILHVARLRH
jgi:hypothetical protein